MLKGRKPTKKEQERLDLLGQMPCIVCSKQGYNSPGEIHHLDGKTKPDAHMKTISLCWRHHREGSDCEAYTSRHPWKARFVQRYGTEESLLEETNIRIERLKETL